MNSLTYESLSRYAGGALAWSHPWPTSATVPFPVDPAAAVFAAFDRDDRCCYVGSVKRSAGSGLADRIAEHRADRRKRVLWHRVWVLPLRPDTRSREVRRIEGVVGAHLGPWASCRLPAPLPARRPVDLRTPAPSRPVSTKAGSP